MFDSDVSMCSNLAGNRLTGTILTTNLGGVDVLELL